MTFLGVDEVREFEWVADKEDRGIIPYQIPISFLCIEFHGKTANVAFGIGRTPFTGYRRETQKTGRLFANLKYLGFSILGNVIGDA